MRSLTSSELVSVYGGGWSYCSPPPPCNSGGGSKGKGSKGKGSKNKGSKKKGSKGR